MKGCPETAELCRLLDGELSERRAQTLREHSEGCPSCQTRLTEQKTLLERIAAPMPGVTPAEDAVARVMARLDSAPAPSSFRPALRVPKLAWGLGVPALAAAVVAVLVYSQREPTRASDFPDFAPRGTGKPLALHQQVGVNVYEVAQPVRKLERGARVSPKAAFVAGYTNLASSGDVFLTVFAVDARNEVHWLYPGHSDPGKNPSSLRLASVRDTTLLPESVALERPAPGPMRILSIVSRQPLKVSDVDPLPPSQLQEEALRARWPDASITATQVDITE